VVHTLAILMGMMLLVALAAQAILGPGVLPWLAGGITISALIAPRPDPGRLLRWSGGRPLPPELAPNLGRAVEILARRAELPSAPAVYFFPGSRPNAFTVGDADRAAIGLTAGLLRRLDTWELTAILAHEISHLRNGDARVMGLALSAARLAGMMSFLGAFLLMANLPLLLSGMATVSWSALLLLTAAPMLAVVLQLSLSRAREIDADLSAVELTGDPSALASALLKIQTRQGRALEELWTQIYGRTWWRTHPAAEQRIRLLHRIERRASDRPER